MSRDISNGVSEIVDSSIFIDATLKPMGYIRALEDLCLGQKHQAIGCGNEIKENKLEIGDDFSTDLSPGPGFHLAISTPNKNAVD
jgi:hypothetical protein